MPNLEEEFCKMHGAKIFSKMDMQSAFHQIKMNEGDKEKTAFSTGHKKFQFKRMPFGLKGSPITWQLFVTNSLGELLAANVIAYMDDIMSYNKTVEAHVETLIKIFECLRRNGLKLKIEKTTLFAKEIKYLGHVMSENGVKPNEENVETVKNFPRPRNVKQVQRFLGMASYFRKFLHQFATKAKPLHNLCKKDAVFTWSTDCEQAFETLKRALTTSPVLAFPNFKNKFYISVDASFYAVGAYISNDPPPNDKPIEYFSKTLSSTQQNYSTTHKELLAIILAIEHFQHYIWGKNFSLYTDHQALTYLFSQNKVGSRLLRWKILLSEYDFDIIHRKGKNNVVSDCLSRIGEDPNENVEMRYFHRVKNPTIASILQVITRSRAKENQILAKESPPNESRNYHINEEPNCTLNEKKYEKIFFIVDDTKSTLIKKIEMKLKRKLRTNPIIHYENIKVTEHFQIIFIPKFRFEIEKMKLLINEIRESAERETLNYIAINFDLTVFKTYFDIKCEYRQAFRTSDISTDFYIFKQIELTDIKEIHEILATFHSSLLGGHRGFERMKNSIKRYYVWPSMNNDIRKFIDDCAICEKTKIHKHTHTPLQITSVANAPFEKIYIDFVDVSPSSPEGHKNILTMSCDLTKYIIMVPVLDCTSLTAAKNIVEQVCLVYNIPKIIVSDNGPAFVADVFKQIMKLLGIQHTINSSISSAKQRWNRALSPNSGTVRESVYTIGEGELVQIFTIFHLFV